MRHHRIGEWREILRHEPRHVRREQDRSNDNRHPWRRGAEILRAARIGERRIRELVDRYGLETVRAFATEWLDYSERRMGEAIARLPATRLKASSAHDPMPGLPDGAPVNVEVSSR